MSSIVADTVSEDALAISLSSNQPVAGSMAVGSKICCLPFGVFTVKGPVRSRLTLSKGTEGSASFLVGARVV